jgi:ribosome-associated protein
LATRRHGPGDSGEPARPRIKTSHEKPPSPHGERRRGQRSRGERKGASPPRPRTARKSRATAEVTRDAATWSVASDSAREVATAIAAAGLEKKAIGLEILDVAGKVDYADFLVIMTGRSDRHAQAIAQGIEEVLKKKGVRPVAVEGLPHATWVLMDFGDVVVHVFQQDARQLYDIEGLWLDARRLPVPVSVD